MLTSTSKHFSTISINAAILAGAILVSCVSSGDLSRKQLIQPDGNLPEQVQPLAGDLDINPKAGYPQFPGLTDALPVTRMSSEAETTLMGDEFLDAEGEGNGPGETDPDGYVIAPGDNDDIAWAIYGIGGFSPDRPQNFQIDVNGVIAPGDNEDLPLSFWIGLSNYSNFAWEWFGPYSSATSLELNSQEIRERYVSLSDSFYFAVLTDASEIEVTPNNPQGISAVEVSSTTTQAIDALSPEYFPTVPHYPTEPSSGMGGSKESSTLDPATQYVTLNWTHHTDSVSQLNEASGYRVLRRRIGGGGGVSLLNIVDAPITTFTDPTHTNPVLGEPVAGETYAYYVRGVNNGGKTRFSHAGRQHIPLFPATELTATNARYTDRIVLAWQKPEGAAGFEIFRNTQVNRIAIIGDLNGWADTNVGDFENHTYWVRARNSHGSPSPFSNPATGRVNAAPLAVLSIGNGQETGTWPHTVVFDASASSDPDSSLPGNGIVRYEWDFDGDGDYENSGSDAQYSFEYDAVFGDFNATVRVTDSDDATATASVQIHVNDPPNAVLNASPTNGQPGLEVTFDASNSTDQDDGIDNYEWDFNGNGVYNEVTAGEAEWIGETNPIIIYLNMGIFNSSVRVTDVTGATDVKYVEIDIWT